MSLKTMLAVVDTCPLFEGLSNRERYYILRYFSRRDYPPGTVVIREGELVEELHIVASGRWEVYLPPNEDYLYRRRKVQLQVVGNPGMLLGEYSFIDGKPASASVECLARGELYGVGRRDFEKIVESSNKVGKVIYRNLLYALVNRLRRHNEETDMKHLMNLDG